MPKSKARVSFVWAAVVAVILAGCSTQARRVDCDGRLRPINAPAPTQVPAVSPSKAKTP
jgi:hypothetical protein